MRGKRRTQDYHFIKSPRQAVYYAAEIPRTAWKLPNKSLPGFQLVVLDSQNVTPIKQKEFFTKVKEGKFFNESYLILLCSDQTDSLAISTGYDLMKLCLEKNLRVQITESSRIKEEETSEETVFMLFNVYDEAPSDRLQDIRDWSYRHEDVCRIVCATGDPATLMRKLKIKFNAVFYLESRITEEKTLA